MRCLIEQLEATPNLRYQGATFQTNVYRSMVQISRFMVRVCSSLQTFINIHLLFVNHPLQFITSNTAQYPFTLLWPDLPSDTAIGDRSPSVQPSL